jgi:Vanadium chloroperoxidase N-terminal domain
MRITSGSTTGKVNHAKMIDAVKFWHNVALEVARLDYSSATAKPVNPAITYTSRAQAMVHIAMHDAYIGLTKEHGIYSTHLDDIAHNRPGARRSLHAAFGTAADHASWRAD